MKIKFRKYKDGIHNIELSEKVQDIGLEEPYTGRAGVSCRMDKSEHQIILTCSLSVEAKLECDRCTEQFTGKLEPEFRLVYFFNRHDAGEDENDVYYISPEQDEIDISEDVREYAGLAMPLKVLCSVECKGICSGCGKNLNEEECVCTEDKINPVWEPLLKLKKNNPNK